MKRDKKNLLGNIFKWLIILALLIIVYFWKNDDIMEAFEEMRHYSIWVSLLCLLATLLHFCVEGRIIHNMTMYEERQMTWWESFKCGLYCAFYKLISLGSLSGIAEVYYISKHGVEPGRATGITLVQYAYQKLGITIVGVLSFVGLYLSGVTTVRDYAKWGVLGSVVSLLIVSMLITLSASRKLAELLSHLVDRLIGKGGIISRTRKDGRLEHKSEELKSQIVTFNESGRFFWQHKTLCLRVTILKMLKMTLWYSVAAIVVCAANDANPVQCTALMAVSNMIGSVMIAPAGVGTLEFVVALLFKPLFGATAATVVILYRFYSMVVPFLLGAAVILLTKPGSISESSELS